MSWVGKGLSLSCLHATEGTANVVGATGVGGEAGKIATGVVAAGADMAKDQAAADPDAGVGERLALGVSKCKGHGAKVNI